MTFVIEALGLTSGGGKAGLMQLVPALARHTKHWFVAMLADLPEFAGLARPNLKLVVRPKPGSLVAREIYLQRAVPRMCAAERADALLCLGNFAPRRCVAPTVVLLHNAHYVSRDRAFELQSSFRERLVTWYGRRILRRLPSGVQLVVQTELMKRRLTEAYPRLASKVIVIPDRDGLPSGLLDASSDAAHVDGTDRSAVPFTFLCLAQYYSHKNLEALVEACGLLRSATSSAVRCLLTIDASQHPRAGRLLEKIKAAGLSDVVVNLGPLPADRVAQAYRAADALILPTLLESFGRTYREAMRFGLPILTSDRDFARDACSEAAVYFDPLRPSSIAESMARVIESKELRHRLSHAGLRRAAQAPSWDEIAGQFVRVLEEAAMRRPGFGVRCSELQVGPPAVAGSL